MSETERQFREHGWTRTASCMFRWEHETHGVLYLDPDTREELMDMWITGFVAGKEHNNAQ